MIVLTDDNFMFNAARAYKPVTFNDKEFLSDLKRFKYIKRLFNKYLNFGVLKERLILNHIVILFNVFDRNMLLYMLCFKLDGYLSILKPFLVALNYCPDNIEFNSIMMDNTVIEKLRQILN